MQDDVQKTDKQESRIWKIRTIKNYPEAHSHLLVGQVLKMTEAFVRLHCRTYHYGRTLSKPGDVKVGNLMIRIVPWSRIEIINELPSAFNYKDCHLTTLKDGCVFFSDGVYVEPVGSGSKFEVRY